MKTIIPGGLGLVVGAILGAPSAWFVEWQIFQAHCGNRPVCDHGFDYGMAYWVGAGVILGAIVGCRAAIILATRVRHEKR